MESKAKFKWDGYFIKSLELIMDILLIIIAILIVYSIKIFRIYNFAIISLSDFIFTFKTYLSIPLILINISYLLVITFFIVIYKATAINKKYSQTLFSVILSFIFSSAIYFLMGKMFNISQITFLITTSLFVVQLTLFILYKRFVDSFIRKRTMKSVLIFGAYHDLEKYLSKFLNYLPDNRIIKYVVFENGDIDERIFYYVDEVDRVYILPNTLEENKNLLITYCIAQKNIDLCLVPKLYEVGITNSSIEVIDDILVYNLNSLHLSLTERFFKRLFDLVFSAILLIICFPIMLIIAFLIKIYDKGNVIYKQERVTINGKKFMLYKFRTMIMNAESQTGMVWSTKEDSRITKIGKVIRSLRLDELPQLVNVLKGDMSIVGPRPERPKFVDDFITEYPEFQYRLNVKAGITGLAQIYGKYNTSPSDKIRYDLYYIKKYNFWLDIKLILLTLKTVFERDSTRGVTEAVNLEDILNELSEDIKVINL